VRRSNIFPASVTFDRGSGFATGATAGLIGAVNMLVDITARKQVEERMLLVGRGGPLLEQSARGDPGDAAADQPDTADEFQAAFQGRLSALVSAQRPFSASLWAGASLSTIIWAELRPYSRGRRPEQNRRRRCPAGRLAGAGRRSRGP